MLEYHTNLHHSQTYLPDEFREAGLSTILIYIILKQAYERKKPHTSLSTILIYIILKPFIFVFLSLFCLSTILIYIILKPQTSNSRR